VCKSAIKTQRGCKLNTQEFQEAMEDRYGEPIRITFQTGKRVRTEKRCRIFGEDVKLDGERIVLSIYGKNDDARPVERKALTFSQIQKIE